MPRESRSAHHQRCPVCAVGIAQPVGPGRPRAYCSHACRQVAYRRRRNGESERRLVTLIEGDAREWLPMLCAESVDLIVTDPPYRFDRGNTYFRKWFEEIADREWPTIFHQLHRVLRTNAHAYVCCDPHTKPVFDEAARRAGFRVHERPIVWDKQWLGLGGAWRSTYEFVAFYEKGRRPGNYRTYADIVRSRRPHRQYPTQKPVPLFEALIRQSSSRGELVLDPFCGSGTTGIAARRLNRRALLCDIDAKTAARRLRLQRS